MTATTFTATVEQAAGKSATGIEVPLAVLDELGAGRRSAVVVTLGAYEYRTTVGVMGGRHLLPLSAERRSEAGVAAGDEVVVGLRVDTAPRTTEVPADLAAALEDAGQRPTFDALSPSRRKEHVRSIESAKAPATRERRVAKVVASLSG
jgi:hypothetical protein